MSKDDIGVISSVDGIDVNDITAQDREQWADVLVSSISNLDAVEEVFVEDASSSYQSVRIAAQVTSSDAYTGYELHINPHSFGQKLRHTISADTYANMNISEPTIESPTKLDTATDRYDTPYYFIDVSYP